MQHDHHAHGSAARSERGPYLDFVDELFRLKLIDRDKRDFLREGLQLAAGGAAPAPVVLPASSHCRVSEAGMKRAADAKLVETLGRGRYRVLCGPETVHWGYLWGAAEPVLRVNPGERAFSSSLTSLIRRRAAIFTMLRRSIRRRSNCSN